MICPRCNGTKTFTGFVSVHREDGGRCSIETYNCSTCDGVGEITNAHAAAIEAGKKMREGRISRNATLAAEAGRLGISMVELSALEHGKT